MAYSTIQRKPCKCGKCGRMPTIGCQGYHHDCNAEKKQELIDRVKKRNALKRDSGSIRKLIKPDKRIESKSELLQRADKLFSQYIRNRDSDKNGNVACVCCGKIYNVSDKDKEGNLIIQNLHFIDRDVYSLRFSEDNCKSGCTWCNFDMFKNKKGTAWKQYRDYLVATFGENEVAEMELQHRKINKLELTELKNIIKHYSN